MIKNPWKDMPEQSQRRSLVEGSHDVFWITDLEGKYGFVLHAKKEFSNLEPIVELKGITMIKRNSTEGKGELFLLLNNKEDWEIFHALCENLISTVLEYSENSSMLHAVEIRLKRWQQLLKQDTALEMSTEKQMGLFSELSCLEKFISPQFGIEQAILSWVGPDFDKQDFILENIAIEVKSYRTSKGKKINISSLEQLEVTKDGLFLITYGLTENDNGKNIEDLVESIGRLLKNSKNNTTELFETKLIQYGYIPEIKKTPYIKFSVDKQQQYSVIQKFPKISRNQVSSLITHVKYSIDLAQCDEYEVGVNEIIDKAKS
jgi:hypothetical protein